MKNSENLNKIEIYKIPPIPNQILEAASNGKLVVFIGAGVSRLLGYVSWQSMAERYVKYLFQRGYFSYLEYEHLKSLDARKLLSICENFCKKNKIPRPSISGLLHSKEVEKDTSDIYKLIYSWNVVYITTNFDDELDKVVNDNKKIISDPEQISIAYLYELGTVIHLHGSLDSRRLILTISDYLYYYQTEKMQKFLNHLFTEFSVLFIGYGLEEYELLEFLVHKSQMHTSDYLKSEKKEIKHYLLYPVFSWEKAMLKFYQLYYRDLSIELIPYKKDEKGYQQLYEVIKKWTPMIKEYVRPPTYLDKLRLIDEVVK